MTKDMTKGVPWKLILFFTIPILIGNIFQQFYNMADTIIVGRFVDIDALAAVGTAGPALFLMLGFAIGMTGGFGIIAAQKFGANDDEGVRYSVATSIILCSAITVILTLISMLTANALLKLMNTPENILDEALLYMIIMYAGTGTIIYYNMIASILRALGDSKTPLYFLCISSLLNIILDLALIIIFHMGVAGAAVATVISQLISAVLCTFYTARKYKILRLKKRHFKINKVLVASHLKLGIPMALQSSITAVGVMILQAALNVFGSDVIAAYTAANKVEAIIMQIFNSLGLTMATYCGQNMGANQIGRIKQGVKSSTFMCLAGSGIGICINVFIGSFLTGLFMNEVNIEILRYAQQYLNIVAAFYPALAILFLYRNVLQGVGDSLFPMLGGVTEFIARLLIIFTLPVVWGYLGVCLASPVAWLAAAALLVIRYWVWIKKLPGKTESTNDFT